MGVRARGKVSTTKNIYSSDTFEGSSIVIIVTVFSRRLLYMLAKEKSLKGVYRCGKKWKSQIQVNGVQHYLGIFSTQEGQLMFFSPHFT